MLSRLRSLVKRPPHEERLPASQRVYAVGDIHGRADLLDALLAHIQADAADTDSDCHNALVFLGDYIDRGPASNTVLDTLAGLAWPGWEMTFLRGNHEQFALDFLSNAEVYRDWRSYGAAETLFSYDVTPPSFSNAKEIAAAQQQFRAALPLRHQAFLMELSPSHSIGGYYFAHAGVRPGVPLDQQVPEDLLWIRDPFLLCEAPFGKVVVHGHTPSDEPVLKHNRIGIDTGAYATSRLTAVRLAGNAVQILSVQG